jgi:hypothetical protein
MKGQSRLRAWAIAVSVALVLGGVLVAGALHGGNGASSASSQTASLAPDFAPGGPAPTSGPPSCPGSSTYTAQIVVWPGGFVTPVGAPLTQSGSVFTLQDPVAGSVLVLDSNITVNGSECLITYSTVDGFGNNTGIEVRNATGVTAEYFDVSGTFADGILVDHASAVTVYDSVAEDALEYGLYAKAASDVNFTGNNVSYSQDGITFSEVTDGVALDNQAVQSSDAGLYNDATADVAYLGNDAAGAARYGAYLDTDSGSYLEGNDISGVTSSTGYGVYSDESSAVTLSGNNLDGAEPDGVLFDSPSSSVAIDHNQITGGHKIGVEIENSYSGSAVTISDNDIQNSTTYGIESYGAGVLTANGNQIRANSTSAADHPYGIYVFEAYGTQEISGNDLTGGYYYGVYLDSEGAPISVTDNDIANATEAAVFTDAVYGLTISGNDLSVNTTTAEYAIYIDVDYTGSGPLAVTGNLATGGWAYALYIYIAYAPVEVSDNDFANATDYAIYVAWAYSGFEVDGNDLSANATTAADQPYGIYAYYFEVFFIGSLVGPVVIGENNFSNTHVGVYLTETYGAVTINDNVFTNVSAAGIDLGNDEYYGPITIEGNTFSQVRASDDAYATEIDYAYGSVTFSNNTVSGAMDDGLLSDGLSGPLTVTDNRFNNLTDYGVYSEDAHDGYAVDGNTFFGNDSRPWSGVAGGAYLDDSGGGALGTVSNNTIGGGLGVGLDLDFPFSPLNVISGNVIRDTVNNGIYVDASGGTTVVSGNTISSAQGTDIRTYETDNLTVEQNVLRDSNVSLNASSIQGTTVIEGNNDSHSNLSLVVESNSVSYSVEVADNDLSDSGAAYVNDTLVALVANDLLGTPEVGLPTNTFTEFYHNDIDTASGSSLNFTDSSPELGVYNAPLPVGGNYWTGYVPTTCTGGICAPPYNVPSLGTPTGVYDEYPLGTAWSIYAVTFSEAGLPAGTPWSVVVGGTSLGAVAPASVEFFPQNVQPTSYGYNVPTAGAYVPTPPRSGSFTASGHSFTIALTFTLPSFPVNFTESGLALGSTWYVNSTGSPSFVSQAFSVTVPDSQTFSLGNLSNGTYGYLVAVGAPYYTTSTPFSGSFTVSGTNVTVRYAYTFAPPMYAVTFTVSGLPSGSSWTVTFDGTPLSSSTPTISANEPNGVYPYSVKGPGGYTFAPTSGSVSVSGGTVSVFVVASPTGTSPSGGLSSGGFGALLAGLVAAAVLAGLGWALYARGRSGGGSSSTGAPPPGAGGVKSWDAGPPSGAAPPGGETAAPPPPPAGPGVS